MNKVLQYVGSFLLLVFLLSSCSKERVLQLNNLPSNTPEGSKVYIMGSFNNWNPADSQFLLEYNPAYKTYSISLPTTITTGTYKYTRGNIESIETDICGNEQTSRTLTNDEIVLDTVAGWADIEHIDCEKFTLIIQSDRGIMPDSEDIYLTRAIPNGKYKLDSLRFQNQQNGTYILTVAQKMANTSFNLFRSGVSQFEAPQQLMLLNDTILLTLSAPDSTKDKSNPKTTSGNEKKLKRPIAAAKPSITFDKPIIPILPGINQVVATTPAPDPTPKIIPAPVVVHPPVVGSKQAETIKPIIAATEKKEVEEGFVKKVFVIIDKLPSYGKGEDLYLAGDFNDWDIANVNYVFRSLPNGKKYLLLRMKDNKAHEFKITRGEPGTDEANYKEEAVDFHEIAKGSENDTIHVRIDSWLDAYPRKRLVIFLVDVPENTPARDNIYLTGGFNKWKTDDDQYKFTALGDNEYALTIEDYSKQYTEYKISRGSFDNEAISRNGRVPQGQPFDFIRKDTIKLRIEQWKDLKYKSKK